MNPFTHIDEDEKVQESSYQERLRCERYWHEQAVMALDGNWKRYIVCRNRALFYWQLRVANVLY